ncbi:hypothetical protein D3C77_766200 [compost metagenome]
MVSSPSSKVGPALAPPLAKPMATASQRRRARPVFDVNMLLSFVVIVCIVRLLGASSLGHGSPQVVFGDLV